MEVINSIRQTIQLKAGKKKKKGIEFEQRTYRDGK